MIARVILPGFAEIVVGIGDYLRGLDSEETTPSRTRMRIVLAFAIRLFRENKDVDNHSATTNFTSAEAEFKRATEEILSWGDCDQREVALRAVEATTSLYLAAAPQSLNEIISGITAAARTARRAEPIDEIIRELALDLWQRKPSFRDNPSGTAHNIHQAFREKLQLIDPGSIPAQWSLATNEIDEKKEFERIRKRVAKLIASRTDGSGPAILAD